MQDRMSVKNTKQAGFTIVELLIVIVVIGILAAITIVAYTGIQNSAHDAAVRSDLTNIAKKQEIFKIENPDGRYAYGNTGPLSYEALDVKISRDAYRVGDPDVQYNLLNCMVGFGTNYALLAVSKSGKRFYISPDSGGVQEYTGSTNWLSTASCTSVLPGSGANGAGYGNGVWRDWAME